MTYQTPHFKENYDDLPADVQDAFTSVSVGKTIQEIGKKHQLHVDQISSLFDETGFIMIGATHPRNYIENIQSKLAIDVNAAKKIATDVNEQIFRPIRESLKKIHQVDEKPEQDTTVEQSSEKQEPKTSDPANETSMTKAEKTVEEAPRGNIKITEEELARVHQKHQDAYKELGEQTPEPQETAPQPASSLDLRVKKVETTQPSQEDTTSADIPARLDGSPSLSGEEEAPAKQEKPAKPFFKITPQNIKEAVKEGHQKEVAPPENLPIVSENLPVAETQPSSQQNETKTGEEAQTTLSGISTMEQDVEHAKEERETSRSEAVQKIPETPLGKIIKSKPEVKDSITEKLSGSFKLPRKETEYKEVQTLTKPEKKEDYGKIDPYREPTD